MNQEEPSNQRINGENISNDTSAPKHSSDEAEEFEIDQTEADILQEHEECPSCFEGDHRWIYECLTCAFIGCYDEVYDNGCYLGSPDERLCPECNGNRRMRIGKVGKGSVEEYD